MDDPLVVTLKHRSRSESSRDSGDTVRGGPVHSISSLQMPRVLRSLQSSLHLLEVLFVQRLQQRPTVLIVPAAGSRQRRARLYRGGIYHLVHDRLCVVNVGLPKHVEETGRWHVALIIAMTRCAHHQHRRARRIGVGSVHLVVSVAACSRVATGTKGC